MARRSVLFAPGDRPDRQRSAAKSGADVVVFDLEDAVAPSDRPAAREAVAGVLADLDADCEVCVRVTPPHVEAAVDLDGVLAAGGRPDSVMLPKASGAADVSALADLLVERDLSCPILALLETAAGVLSAETIADHEAVDAVCFGAEDLAADLGATRTPEGTEVLAARQRVVLAAAATDVDAVDTLVTDFEDDDRCRHDARRAARWGYDGKIAIHPRQVPIVNEAFTPDAERVRWAERVVEAAEAAEGSVFELDGEMIDGPLIAQAEAVLQRAPDSDDE